MYLYFRVYLLGKFSLEILDSLPHSNKLFVEWIGYWRFLCCLCADHGNGVELIHCDHRWPDSLLHRPWPGHCDLPPGGAARQQQPEVHRHGLPPLQRPPALPGIRHRTKNQGYDGGKVWKILYKSWHFLNTGAALPPALQRQAERGGGGQVEWQGGEMTSFVHASMFCTS